VRIAVIGAGGVGGYFGAQLAAGGADVTFIARGPHLEAMRERGLRVESPAHPQWLHPVKATSDAESVGPVDLVVIAVKLWSTEQAIASARPLLGQDTGVVSFQNGVDAADRVAADLGASHAFGGMAHIAAVIEAPGVVRHNGTMAKLTFGELDGRASARTEAFLSACQAGGIEAYLVADVRRATWEKFVFLVGLSGLTCLTRSPIGAVRDNPVTRDLLRAVMQEVVSVAAARGVALPDDTVERQMTFVDGLPHGMIASMLADLRSGGPLELEWLAGAVVRMGREHGVPTPVNHCIHGALTLHAKG